VVESLHEAPESLNLDLIRLANGESDEIMAFGEVN
jgi:hypothetical protein